MSTRKSSGIYFLMGIGLGAILIPSIRKRVLSFMKNMNPDLYNDLANFKERLESAIAAGIEAAGSENKTKSVNKLIELEADEESPNYII